MKYFTKYINKEKTQNKKNNKVIIMLKIEEIFMAFLLTIQISGIILLTLSSFFELNIMPPILYVFTPTLIFVIYFIIVLISIAINNMIINSKKRKKRN